MNLGIKLLWVIALRSGKYAQVREHLKFETSKGCYSHCCLGVLLEASKDVAEVQAETWDQEEETLTSAALHEAGIPYGVEADLIIMNDQKDKTFSEIADYIEANL